MEKQKIVVTGGLGYIGTELAKLYVGETRNKEIVFLDNRFISERVTYLRSKGIKFQQINILNYETLAPIISDADIVIHLAGVTDVAYVRTQSNSEQEQQIKDTAITGTENILKAMSENGKIIFPSTHVIFEGFNETMLNITEEKQPTPVLTYSTCKVVNERDIINSNKDYIILRLGSVYGYSNDTMRIGIVPNLFSKMSSQNQTLKLFSNGIQHKSLVSVFDVARCIKFMVDSDIRNETFHLTNENMTVKEIAEICKEINPKTNIIETDDEIPNLGYTLSNKKLLDYGFQFKYGIVECMREMIEKWSENDINDSLEFIIKSADDFIDNRGVIKNYNLPESINMIGYIESKKGTLRANHFHPLQEQKCLLIKGKYISVIKDITDPDAIIKTQIINEGDLSVIPPNVAHSMIFLEDSIFLNLVNGDRKHEEFNKTHTISYPLVNEELKKNLLNHYSQECRCCGNKYLKPVISLGLSPLANNLENNPNDDCEEYPLEMMYCDNCHNCQLSYVVPAHKMFDNYLYTSSTTKSFREHFEKAAESFINRFSLNEKSYVLDIGSNDGITLLPLKERGINVVGVEPAKNISLIANKNGILTFNSYFDEETVIRIYKQINKKFDIITASNVFAHSNDLTGIINNAFTILKSDGTFIIEVQYLLDTLKDVTFDNIYHEHVNYWSVTSLNNFCDRLGYVLSDVEHIDTHGGSIRAYIQRGGIGFKNENVVKFLKTEEEFGMKNYKTYLDFAKKVENLKINVRNNFNILKQKYDVIAGYGSPAKATTALNYFNLHEMDYIVEDNPLKHNKYIPGVNIPIVSKENKKPNVFIVNAWNFFNEIITNNFELSKDVIFINIKDLENE